jgi:hypothetical protein
MDRGHLAVLRMSSACVSAGTKQEPAGGQQRNTAGGQDQTLLHLPSETGAARGVEGRWWAAVPRSCLLRMCQEPPSRTV